MKRTSWNKGIPHTEETKEKMRKTKLKIGSPWNIGKKMSEEHKKILSKVHTGNKYNVGIKRTLEEKENLSVKFRGENHPNWQGGLTKIAENVRKCFKYRQWRSDIYERDNYTCQECGSMGKKLEAHHIKPFCKIMKENNIKNIDEALECEELWNINNGITLCKECHKETYSYLNNKIIKNYE